MSQISPTRYNGGTIALHWLSFILVAATFAFIEFRGIFPKGTDARETMKLLHFLCGFGVLALTLLRLVWRITHKTPPIVPTPSALNTVASHAGHALLYLALIGLPLSGLAMLTAAGKPLVLPLLNLTLAMPVPLDKALAGDIKEVHELVASTLYVLIGLHAAAALWHHWLVRDNTLVRMLPIGRRE